MNTHTSHIINMFFEKYSKRVFDQDDVRLFISSVRDYTKRNGVLRELGDFLAHPECKNRGISITNFTSIISYFEDNAISSPNQKLINSPPYKSIGDAEEILLELAYIFNLTGRKLTNQNENDLALRDFIFCVIFLLGGYKLKFNDRLFKMSVIYGHSLELAVEYESGKHSNHFASLTVLFLRNIWKESRNQKIKLEGHIVRRFDNGHLMATSYENDLVVGSSDTSKYKKGDLWPLPNYQE